MDDALPALEKIATSLSDLKARVLRTRRNFVDPVTVRPLASKIASRYYERVHRDLTLVQHRAGLCDEVEFVLAAILALTTEPRKKAPYLRLVAELGRYVQEAMIDVMRARGNRLVLSNTEREILVTLGPMLPETALSYEQVLSDLVKPQRISWRGTGAELREILREVMDHLAPDDQVMAAPGFQLEQGRSGPTQKQKVRHILKARNTGSAAIANTEESLATIESIATLARSTYRRGSASAHKTATLAEVRKLKHYVDALLADLLEIAV